MDKTTVTIALAGLLHDVGKFAERAGMELPAGYSDNNAGLYQPFRQEQGRHTHKHALYSAAFIEQFSSILPTLDDQSTARSGDSLINLAAMHHKPETPLQWIIAQADRLSSGLDRQVFEGDETGTAYRDFRKTRLIPLAEELQRGSDFYQKDTLASYVWRYRLAELTPEQTFPVIQKDAEPTDDKAAIAEYAALFKQFTHDLAALENRTEPQLWLEHFSSLWERFTACIPAATVGKVIPDVSLYDHSRAAAALATALYRYHAATNSLTEAAVKESAAQKFLLVTGDFSGIQNFIFSAGNSTNKAAAKLLRGRSFAVSLLSELAAHRLCTQLGLPATAVLLDAAGKFTLVAPNLPETAAVISAVGHELNRWLLDHYYGEVSIGLSSVAASPSDFEKGRFPELWQRLGRAADSRKFRKLQLADTGVIQSYLDRFDNNLGICPFCGKRPADPKTGGDSYLGDNETSCLICRDHIHLGADLVKSASLAIVDCTASFPGNKLKEPLFGHYQLSFNLDRKTAGELAQKGLLVRNLTLVRAGKTPGTGLTVRSISGYVPVYIPEDDHDDRLVHGKSSDEKKLELIAMIKEGGAKSFAHIAKSALNHRLDAEGKFSGVEALGILKADVDNLGKLFACGLPEERLNLSRLATFSRQLNSFFTLYLPNLLATDIRFQNIYTVFAGGDDLFLIGPWNKIISFAGELHERFSQFACNNKEITISVGISVGKPGIPVPTLAERGEEALKLSKKERNNLTVFGETVTWPEFATLQEKCDRLLAWQETGVMGKAMLYRLNELISLAEQERKLRESKRPIELSDMSCLGWRSRLTYSATRNVGKGLDKANRQAALDEVVQELPDWLMRYDSKLKIALWQVLYNQR
jgi:CRISPR-associated protein Csm1